MALRKAKFGETLKKHDGVCDRQWKPVMKNKYEGWGLENEDEFINTKFKDWWSGKRWRDLFAVSVRVKVVKDKIVMEFSTDGNKKNIKKQISEFFKQIEDVDINAEISKMPSKHLTLSSMKGKYSLYPDNAEIKYYGMLGIVTLQEAKIELIGALDWSKVKSMNELRYEVKQQVSIRDIWEQFLSKTTDKVGKNIVYHTAHKSNKGMKKDKIWSKVQGTVRKNISRGDELVSNVRQGRFPDKYS